MNFHLYEISPKDGWRIDYLYIYNTLTACAYFVDCNILLYYMYIFFAVATPDGSAFVITMIEFSKDFTNFEKNMKDHIKDGKKHTINPPDEWKECYGMQCDEWIVKFIYYY